MEAPLRRKLCVGTSERLEDHGGGVFRREAPSRKNTADARLDRGGGDKSSADKGQPVLNATRVRMREA